jgi:glucokinase
MMKVPRMPSALPERVLVYDVGGSHVSAAVWRGGALGLGDVVTAPHPVEESSTAFVEFIHSLGVEARAGEDCVAGAELAVPGPFDFTAGVSLMRHKLPHLYGVDLRRELAERFGWQVDRVRFVHDAAAFLLGEIGAGAARGISRTVGITLGTGIGSAFAVNGRLVTAGPGVAPGGEIWNLPSEGGILEDFVSSRAIQRNYRERAGVLSDVAAIAAAAAHDPAAASAFAEFGRHLGKALAAVLAEFGPDLVVLGGGISRSASLFLPAAEPLVKNHKICLRISALQGHAPLVGAAAAWFDGLSFPADGVAPHADAN